MTSLKGRLLASLMILLTVVGGLGSLATYVVALNEPDDNFDNQLRQLAFYIGEGAGQAFTPGDSSEDLEPEDVMLIQIWDGAGHPLRLSDPTIGLPRQTRTGFADLEAGGHAWRTYTLVRSSRTVQISQRTEIRRDLAAEGALRAVYPIAALVPLSWLLLVVTVGRILRPLRILTDDLAGRPAGDPVPLPLAGLPREVAPFVVAMNALLGRQRELLDFRQRFLSDAAHQLRTPLTAARLQAANLRNAVLPGDVRDLSADIERGLKRMSQMVNQLLRLARADAPDRPRPTGRHDLASIAADAIADVLVLADSRTIDIGIMEQAPASILCDRDEVRTLLGNLLDNAVRYTPEGGKVDLTFGSSGTDATVSVADTGPGIAEQDLSRLFCRFVRLGEADVEGSGLGLAIVRAIAARHGAEVAVENRQDRSGLLVSITFHEPPDAVANRGTGAPQLTSAAAPRV